MGATAHRVAFRVLGPLEVLVDDRVVELGSPKVRLLLAALLVDANSVVSSDRLIETLWGEMPPASESGALQKQVHRLRSLVGVTPGPDADVLVTRAPGYLLQVAPGSCDAARFEALVADAHRRAQHDDPAGALVALDQALGLWRGRAFAEFAFAEFARAEAARLEELRVVAIEERLEAKLRLGRHDEVTGELEALVSEYPYRERLWGQLMLALYRAGRQADALRAYGQVRVRLAEELGIDPGASLRNLEEAILLQKPELDWAPPTQTRGQRERWRPALPVALARDVLLVGRRAEAAWLDDLLARAGNGPVGALVRGEPGAGRTTLVTSFGRRAFQQGCAVLYGATSTGRVSTLQPVRDAMTALDERVGSDRRGDAFDDDIDGFSAGMRDAVGDAARATGKPVVVIVDDLDRADPETVDVLRGLLSAVEPVAVMLIATTTVPSGAHDAAEPWWTAERSLAPFTEDEVAELLEFRLGTPPMPELAAAVRDEADGNARRVDELAARLAEAELDQRVERAIARAESVQHDLRLVQGEIATSVAERAHRSRFGRDDGQPDEPAGTERAHACPYKGLASFEAEDEAFFCGRDRQIDDLVARLAVTRFVAVVGPSGSGKSSLVRAGLVPALRRGALPGSAEWETVIVAPGDSTAVERVVVRGPPKHGSRSRVTVIVDHLEELFTGGRDEEVQVDFLGTLARAATTPGGSATVVVAFRGDFYDRFAAFPAFARLLAESQLLVGPMTDDEVHAAIEEPARRAALTLEPGLADAIAADVAGQPGALPLLSTALLQTWVRRRGNVLTHAGYHDTGGVGGAVARLAEDTYLQFTPDEQRACRLLMLRLAEPGEGSDDVRRRVPLAELGETGETEVLQTLVARRLVTTGDGTAEVTHEALLREWPRLARWLEEDRDGRRLHHRVAAAAVEWNTADRDPAELYRGTRLEAALDWSAAHPGEANPLEREFLDAGGAAQDRDLRTARRTARRLRSLATGLAVLLVVAVVAGALALTQRSDANRQATARQQGRDARARDAARHAGPNAARESERPRPPPRRRGPAIAAVDHDRRRPRSHARPPAARARAGHALRHTGGVSEPLRRPPADRRPGQRRQRPDLRLRNRPARADAAGKRRGGVRLPLQLRREPRRHRRHPRQDHDLACRHRQTDRTAHRAWREVVYGVVHAARPASTP